MKSLIPKTFRIVNDIFKKAILGYDEDTNTILIKNKEPLKIVFEGGVYLGVDGDFEVQSNGQIDFITHGSKICLDSLNSQIFLNSRRARYCGELKDQYEDANRQIIKDDGGAGRNEYDRLSYEALYEKICQLESCLDKHGLLEEQQQCLE